MPYIKPEKVDDWRAFAKKIYTIWDADPGYYAIQYSASMNSTQRLRFAVAWCAYYNLGIAADASELQGQNFWAYLRGIYPTAKRATERRHFRGNAGLKALDQWSRLWPKPEHLADYICEDSTTYFNIRKKCSGVVQYGDYFVWKWCDLHEVLGYGGLDMRDSEKYTPKLPQQGAELIYTTDQDNMVGWKNNPYAKAEFTHENMLRATYAEIVRYGRANKIPPRTTEDRKFGLQEAETVCCVYKQMTNGSYIYGTRTAKAVRRLRSGESRTAKNLIGTLLDLSPYTEEQLNERLDSLTEK